MSQIIDIQQINKSYIQNLFQGLISKKLYRSEAQLQFDIAWQIKEDLLSLPDWEVCLEYITATAKWNSGKKEKQKRLYTDILLHNKINGQFIPVG